MILGILIIGLLIGLAAGILSVIITVEYKKKKKGKKKYGFNKEESLYCRGDKDILKVGRREQSAEEYQ